MTEAKGFEETYLTPGLPSLLGQSHSIIPSLQAGVIMSSVQSATLGCLEAASLLFLGFMESREESPTNTSHNEYSSPQSARKFEVTSPFQGWQLRTREDRLAIGFRMACKNFQRAGKHSHREEVLIIWCPIRNSRDIMLSIYYKALTWARLREGTYLTSASGLPLLHQTRNALENVGEM